MLLAVVLLLVLVLALTGCGESTTSARARASAAHARMTRLGARVFAEHCQTCHPLLGTPNTDYHGDYAPPLDLDQVKPTRAYTAGIIASGKVAMGAMGGALSARALRAVVEYVTEVSGREVVVPAGVAPAQLAAGGRVFDAHCARCHALDGRRPTNPNPIWQATSFEDVRPSVLYIEQIVRDGQIQAMPAFRNRLTPEQIRSVARYVNARAR